MSTKDSPYAHIYPLLSTISKIEWFLPDELIELQQVPALSLARTCGFECKKEDENTYIIDWHNFSDSTAFRNVIIDKRLNRFYLDDNSNEIYPHNFFAKYTGFHFLNEFVFHDVKTTLEFYKDNFNLPTSLECDEE